MCRVLSGETVEFGSEFEPCRPSFHQIRELELLCDTHGRSMVQCEMLAKIAALAALRKEIRRLRAFATQVADRCLCGQSRRAQTCLEESRRALEESRSENDRGTSTRRESREREGSGERDVRGDSEESPDELLGSSQRGVPVHQAPLKAGPEDLRHEEDA